MRITLEDIAGIASPGWGEGSVEIPDLDLLDEGLDVEVRDNQDSEDDYEEIGLKKAVPEPTKKPYLYADDGRREGLSTLEICNHCKNRMLRKDLLEQEFLAIRKIYPANGADLKILIWLAAGLSYQETAERVGRTHRTVKNAVQRLRQFRDSGKVRLLPAEQVHSMEALMEPLPKSAAGRKPKKITKIAMAEIIQLDLCGDPIQARKARRRQAAGARKARVRPTMPGQLSLFDMAA